MTTPNNRIEEIVVQGSAESGYGRMLDEIVKLRSDLAARDAELASVKAENSKLRSALEIVHFKREPWQ